MGGPATDFGLKPEVQEAAICQDESKRIILATNVAETSLTIEGVRVVVDSGLARQASFDVGRGLIPCELVRFHRRLPNGQVVRVEPGREGVCGCGARTIIVPARV